MSKSLKELQEVLLQGQKLSMQGSMDRRMPDKKSIPFLIEARKGLKEFVALNPLDNVAWRLLSQAEETLMNYPEALSSLEKSIELAGKDKKDLKRIALLKECLTSWNELGLTPEQMKSLGDFIDDKLSEQVCDHTLSFTKEWLDGNIPKSKRAKMIKAIQGKGGFCDCEVLANVVKD
jgi:tetratricopeptide (TPR) repeat protein